MSYISKVLLPPTCLNFGLPVSPVCLSVSQTSDVSGHKGNTGKLLNSRVLDVLQVITLYIYESSLSLSVSVKVIQNHLTHVLIQLSVIASN